MDIKQTIQRLDPGTVTAVALFVWSIIQQLKKRKYKHALRSVLNSVETHADSEFKASIGTRAMRDGVEAVVREILLEERAKELALADRSLRGKLRPKK